MAAGRLIADDVTHADVYRILGVVGVIIVVAYIVIIIYLIRTWHR